MSKIASVHLFSNGAVAVFDESGRQMPKYQRHGWPVARKKLLKAAPKTTQWFIGVWRVGELETNRECIECESWEAP